MNTYTFVQPQPIQLGFPQYSHPYPGPVGLSPLYYPTQFSPQLQPYYSVSPPQSLYRLSPVLPQPVLGFPQPQYGTSLYLQYPQSRSTPSPLALGQLAYPAAPQQLHGQYQQTQGQFQQPLGQHPQPHGQHEQPQDQVQQLQGQYQQPQVQYQQLQVQYQQAQLAPSAVASNLYRASPGIPQNAQHLAAPQGSQPILQQPQDLPPQSQPAPPAVTQHQHYAAPPVIPQNLQGVPAPEQPRALPTPPVLSPPHPRYATRPVIDRAQLGQPVPPVDYHHAQGQPAPAVLSQHVPNLPTPLMNDWNVQGQSTPPVHPQHPQRHPTPPAHVQHPQGVPPPPRPPRHQAPPVASGTEYRPDVLGELKTRMGRADTVVRRDPAVEQWTRRSSTGAVEGSSSMSAHRTVSSSHGSPAASSSTASWRSSPVPDSAVLPNDMADMPLIPEDNSTSGSLLHVERAVIQQESARYVWPQIFDGNLVYTVTRLLGKGSFGRVGKALVVRSRKCMRCGDMPSPSHSACEVAIKTFNLHALATNESHRLTYEQEIKAWTYITKKRARWLMHLWSVFNDKVNSYLVMKRCCMSLADVCETPCYRDTFNRRAQRRCIEELVQGVEELHRLRIIHRDLKPENILIDEKGHIVITDFGMAERAPRSSDSLPFHQVEFDGYGGSLGYMAPEVLACKSDYRRKYTCAADLWSLGVIIFEIFMGDRCFMDEEESKRDWDIALANMYRRTMCWVPEEARMMIVKLLEYDDKKRYRIEEVINDDFFRETDWNSINQKTMSEWIPPDVKTSTEAEDWTEVLEFPVYESYEPKSWKCSSSLFH